MSSICLPTQCPYEILGVHEYSTTDQINKQFERLKNEYNLFPTDKKSVTEIKINHLYMAHDLLSNVKKRNSYHNILSRTCSVAETWKKLQKEEYKENERKLQNDVNDASEIQKKQQERSKEWKKKAQEILKHKEAEKIQQERNQLLQDSILQKKKCATLLAENTTLKQKIQDYEESKSVDTVEIDRLNTVNRELLKETTTLKNENEQLKNKIVSAEEMLDLAKKLKQDATDLKKQSEEEFIQAVYKQKEEEKAKQQVDANQRLLEIQQNANSLKNISNSIEDKAVQTCLDDAIKKVQDDQAGEGEEDEEPNQSTSSFSTENSESNNKKTDTFKCTVCERNLKNKKTFVRHMNIHELKETYQCDKCSYHTTRKDALKRHSETVHFLGIKKRTKFKKSMKRKLNNNSSSAKKKFKKSK